MAARQGLFSSLRHRDYALLLSAFTVSAIGSWAYNVALAVWIFEETGSAGWIAVATVCRFVPALLFSAYGGVLAERFERVRLMMTIDLAAFTMMVILAVELAVDAPVAVAIATAAITSTFGTVYEPASAALTPQLVGERDLGSANALRNTIDNVCVIAGPGLGGLLLLVGQPWVAVLVNAFTFLFSVGALLRIRDRSTPTDVTEGGKAGPLRQMLVGVKAITSSVSAAVLVAYSIIATFVYGVDTVLFVVVSDEVLGTGAEGYGYLLAGLGVGGIAAAGLVTRLERLPSLGAVILFGMAAYCLPTLLYLVSDSPPVGFAAQVVRGAGTLIVDVLAITALQRSLKRELLARVFGAFNALCLLAVLLGAVTAPILLDVVGLDGSLWIWGLGVPVLCTAGWPILARMDRESRVRREALASTIAQLNRIDVFESVSEGSIDQLAGASETVAIATGQRVVAEGEPADAFYVIEHGEFVVDSEGETGPTHRIGTLGPGEYFGEIGLIERIPRTATVTALTSGSVLRIDGDAFIEALTAAAPSAALLDGASVRLGRTHPSLQLTSSGLDPGQSAKG